MSTAVMSSPMFECGDLLFDKNPATTKLKDTTSNANAGTANTNGRAPLRHSYTSLVKLIQEQHHKLYRSVSEPTSRYKTELCRPFEESGACKYGDKCQFAHGYSELRNLARHPKYKTELCRTFHTIGFCPYGPRCHFIHNFEEARIHNQKVSAQLGSTQPNIMNLNPPLQSGTTTSIGTTTAAATSNGNVNVNVNVSLLEQIASSPQIAAAAAAAAAVSSSTAGTNTPLMRTNSLSLGTQISNVYNPPPLLRTNSLSLTTTSHHHHHHPLHHQQQQQQQHHHQQQQQQQQQIPHHHHQHHHHQSSAISVIGSTRPKPLNLSPTFSLGSTADSVSPSSSLSQSPTNSMASFFSDDQQQQLQSSNNSLSTNAFCFGQDFGLLTSVTRQSPSPSSHTNGICSPIHSDDISPRTPSPLSPNSESRLPVFNRISSTLSDFENLKI